MSNDSLSVEQGIDYDLIQEYLKVNNLKICVLLSCNRSQEYLQMFSKFRGESDSKNDIWYSFWDISNDSIDFETLLKRMSYHVGVVIDLECAEILEFLQKISQRILFHYERYWLMFARSLYQAMNVLEIQNINVDAEISIAISAVEDNRKYTFLILVQPLVKLSFLEYINCMMRTIQAHPKVAN